MASLLQINRVQYVWNEDSNEMAPLCRLYFCKHCLELRSLKNLQHEVDSHFCPQSLDGLPSTEAFLKKNKSANCSQCPSCLHVLSTRATTRPVTSEDETGTETMRKCYYLACTFCRWSSREVGIEDRSAVSGEWEEKPLLEQERVKEVLLYYKKLDAKLKLELEQKKLEKRRYVKQKYGDAVLTRLMKPHPASPYAGALASLHYGGDALNFEETKLKPVKAFGIDDVEKITEEFYGKIDLLETTNLQQRLDQPSHQFEKVKDLYPRQTTMLIKKSLRCKKCEHNLIKPDYNPSSIKFKIVLVAIYFIPEIRISKAYDLIAGESAELIFVINNPTHNNKHVTLTNLKNENSKVNASIELPPSEIKVYNYDEAAIYQATMDDNSPNDVVDEHIVNVKGNKVYFNVTCCPDKDLNPGDDVWVGFSMKHDHVTLPIILRDADTHVEQPPTWLNHSVFVNIGKIKETEV